MTPTQLAIQAAALANNYPLAAEIAEREGLRCCLRCAGPEPNTELLDVRASRANPSYWRVCKSCASALHEEYAQAFNVHVHAAGLTLPDKPLTRFRTSLNAPTPRCSDKPRWPRCECCVGCAWSCPEAPCGDPGDENDGPCEGTELHLRRGRGRC